MQDQPNQLPWYELLKKERERRSLSQQEVAEEMGVDVKTVQRWESGKSFPFPLHRRGLSKIFEKPLSELGLVEDPTDNKNAQTATQIDEESPEAKQNDRSPSVQANVPSYDAVPATPTIQSQMPFISSTTIPATSKTSLRPIRRRPFVLVAGIGIPIVLLLVGILILRVALLPNRNLPVRLPT